MKPERQQKILELLREKNIYTQEEISCALTAAGFSVTQATVSRDIRELGLLKEPAKKGQRYVAPDDAAVVKSPFARVFRDGLVSVDCAENMLVLRTLSGMAMAVAAALDEMKLPDILGSVAGDDVIICVVRNKSAAAKLAEKLEP
ncbi:MAG: arginine repressor [Defluviitaleaceae bacterium]|nr:arginine repressor [Defluviitaleaceae bacterium]